MCLDRNLAKNLFRDRASLLKLKWGPPFLLNLETALSKEPSKFKKNGSARCELTFHIVRKDVRTFFMLSSDLFFYIIFRSVIPGRTKRKKMWNMGCSSRSFRSFVFARRIYDYSKMIILGEDPTTHSSMHM